MASERAAERETQRARDAQEIPGLSEYGEPRGFGWVVFAGVLFMIAGTINIVYGIAAIDNAHFFDGHSQFVISDLKTWGWVVMILGFLQWCVAIGVFAQASWARWTGVVIAGASAIAQLLSIAGYPLLSLSVFALDLLVIYGLVAYGGMPKGLARR
jgi:hypothetical protein